MFKLCFAIAIAASVAVLIEGQAYRPFQFQQTTRSPYYQQLQYQQARLPFYQQNRFQQAGRLPYYAQLQQGYNNRNSYNNNFLNNYYRPSTANEGLARTIIHQNDVRPDGSYQYVYETENGIRGQETNVPKLLRTGEISGNAEGSYGYTSPEGLKVQVNYQADEEGFRPVLSYGGNGAEQFINSANPSSVIINKRP